MDRVKDDIKKKIPRIGKGLHGEVGEYYVSSFFDNRVLVITDCAMEIIRAWIDSEYTNKEKRLFLCSILRNHINRHWIYRDYIILHAGAIYDCEDGKSIIVCGASGSGKTTFVMEAVKSKRFLMIGEDRIVLDKKTMNIIGSKVVHLKEDRLDNYIDYVADLSLVNGGTTEKKYSGSLKKDYCCPIAKVKDCIFLESEKNNESYIKDIESYERLEYFLNLSQEGIYINNERHYYKNMINVLNNLKCSELVRTSDDLNFMVYNKYYNKKTV